MMNKVTGLVFLIVITLAVAGFALADDGADKKGIEQAVLNYVSSIYDMKPELKDLAATLNKDGMFDAKTAPRKVTILDHTDMIANVKLDAAWGIDYIHLSRISGKWMIMNVIWQMSPHE